MYRTENYLLNCFQTCNEVSPDISRTLPPSFLLKCLIESVRIQQEDIGKQVGVLIEFLTCNRCKTEKTPKEYKYLKKKNKGHTHWIHRGRRQGVLRTHVISAMEFMLCCATDMIYAWMFVCCYEHMWPGQSPATFFVCERQTPKCPHFWLLCFVIKWE